MLLLVMQCAGTTYIWWRNQDVVKNKGFTATSIYQDISLPFLQVCTVFAGQMCLIFFYLSSIFNTLCADTMSYVFWLASFFCLQMAAFFNRGSDSLLGTVWNTSEWTDVIRHAQDAEFWALHFGGVKKPVSATWTQLVFRGLFGFIVNNVFREVLAFTVPILLSSFSNPLDFVVYCVGVNFIVTIDDMSEKKFEVDAIPDDNGVGETNSSGYAKLATDSARGSPPSSVRDDSARDDSARDSPPSAMKIAPV
jgi:hypothetical protein